MKTLVTGAAGFIGAAVSRRLLTEGNEVVGLDNLNSYYDVRLKEARLNTLAGFEGFRFVKADISDAKAINSLFEENHFECVVNLAAQAGVRYSIENPRAYVDSNLIGFFNILECCRNHPVRHLVYASSSSVYGANEKVPFSEDDKVDDPVSLYAATKKADELMASCYSKLYGIPATGLRFFTVYGPWGRPDMAPMLFIKAIDEGRPIKLFNDGNMYRDFTYIDDIVEGIVRVAGLAPSPRPDGRRHDIFNIGCSSPVKLTDFISALEDALGKNAVKVMAPMQKGDVVHTYADTSKLEKAVGYKPCVTVRDGVGKLVEWYRIIGKGLF